MFLPLVQVLAPLALVDVLDPRQVAPVLPTMRQTYQMLFLESAILVSYLFWSVNCSNKKYHSR